MAEGITKCDPDDPNRCQALIADSTRQCPNLATESSRFCRVHTSGSPASRARQSNYRLTLWQARLQEKVANPEVKSLRDEIGILRMMLEERLNLCTDNVTLVTNAPMISKLVLDIKEVVKACHTLEQSLGHLLSKTELLTFAGQVVQILNSANLDPDLLDTIAEQIIAATNKPEVAEP